MSRRCPRTVCRPAQVRPRPGPGLGLGIWKSGNLEIWKFGIQQIRKIKVLRIKIRVAQNVGKVWISRKKNFPAPFGAIPSHFLRGPEKSKKKLKECLFSLVGQWALFTRFGVMCWCHFQIALGDLKWQGKFGIWHGTNMPILCQVQFLS